ncbi:MAG: hypothetical protein NC099_05450 [Corallococcus sp.]|nr:hypothetical protein [Corallococcus sp.]
MTDEINRILRFKKNVMIAIDGASGSGKTALSNELSVRFKATCIHCDDFFLPRSMRSASRLAETGGNVHYERLRETLVRAQSGKAFEYDVYKCKTDSFVSKTFDPSKVVIVEGSYSLHPSLIDMYDVKVLLKVSESVQRARLYEREGYVGITAFLEQWIPLENRYLATLDASKLMVFDTSSEQL